MNNYNLIISILIISQLIQFYFYRKTIKNLLLAGKFWKTKYETTLIDLKTLTDQYRQIAKINQALKEIKSIKTKK